MSRRRLGAAVLAICLSGGARAAEEPRLLFDLARGISAPLVATSFAGGSDGRVLFVGCDDAHGCELWRTDGTEEGTALLRDEVPGPCYAGYLPFYGTTPCALDKPLATVTSLGGTVFVAEARLRIWSVSDFASGFPLGPLASVDERSGETENVPDVALDPGQRFVEMGGALYFCGTRPIPETVNERPDYGLYRLDRLDRAGGAVRLASGSASFLSAGPRHLFYRREINPGFYEATWSDGTPQGSRRLVPHLPAWQATPIGVLVAPSGHEVVYLREGANLVAVDVDVTDAVLDPRTVAVRDFTSAGTGVVADGVLYFTGCSSSGGCELWRTDGTDSGTRAIDLVPGAASSSPASLTPFRGGVAFSATDAGGKQGVYWLEGGKTDPVRLTPEATWPRTVRGLTRVGDRLWFSLTSKGVALDPESGIWVSDGSPRGTALAVTGRRGGSSDPGPAAVLGRRLLFSARGRPTTPSEPTAPFSWTAVYAADPGQPPRLVKRQDGWSFVRLYPEATPTFGLFAATACPSGQPHGTTSCRSELWATDGTPDGTRRLEEAPGGASGDLESAVASGRLVYGGLRAGLFGTDGTAEGTERLDPGTVVRIGRAGPRAVVLLWGEAGYVLATTDGTARGTARLLSLTGKTDPELIRPGGEVLLLQTDGELWRSDGTAAGTYRLASSLPAVSAAVPRDGGFLLSTEGPRRSTWPLSWYPMGDHDLRFVPDRPDSQASLLREDAGALAGSVGGRELFVRDLAANRFQLLSSRGSEDAIVELGVFERSEPRPLWSPSDPLLQPLATIVGDSAHFVAATPATGLELWRTDGTPEGTRRVADIARGPASSFPRDLTLWNGRLVFSADDGVHGRELWEMPLSAGTAPGQPGLDRNRPANADRDSVTAPGVWPRPAARLRSSGRNPPSGTSAACGRRTRRRAGSTCPA